MKVWRVALFNRDEARLLHGKEALEALRDAIEPQTERGYWVIDLGFRPDADTEPAQGAAVDLIADPNAMITALVEARRWQLREVLLVLVVVDNALRPITGAEQEIAVIDAAREQVDGYIERRELMKRQGRD